jgi:GTP-binding protein HflX
MRAVLVELHTPGGRLHVEEVADIARSTGFEEAGRLTQTREAPDSRYCVGAGKLEEIKRAVEEGKAEAVIFTRQLNAGQVFRIQRALGGVDVIDRNMLILKLFDLRSTTTEAKLQIELARMRYTFSWARESVRSRGIAGEQVGRGGPGRYPYKAYEMAARNRISLIEQKLKEVRVRKTNAQEHELRSGFRRVALTGYTQSGKTTLFNRFAGETKTTGLGPFTTLSTFIRRVDATPPFLLIDSIGFIDELNPILLRAFHTTLGELAVADTILLLVDGSDPAETLAYKARTSRDIINEHLHHTPTIVCINKTDTMLPERLEKANSEVNSIFPTANLLRISAKSGEGINLLLQQIGAQLKDGTRL